MLTNLPGWWGSAAHFYFNDVIFPKSRLLIAIVASSCDCVYPLAHTALSIEKRNNNNNKKPRTLLSLYSSSCPLNLMIILLISQWQRNKHLQLFPSLYIHSNIKWAYIFSLWLFLAQLKPVGDVLWQSPVQCDAVLKSFSSAVELYYKTGIFKHLLCEVQSDRESRKGTLWTSPEWCGI